MAICDLRRLIPLLAAVLFLGACAAEEGSPSGATRPLDLAGSQVDAPGSNVHPAATSEDGSGAPPSVAGCPEGHWCSTLYPPGWTPDMAADAEGRFLHDFSHAGYHYGEQPPAEPPGATYDVVQFGADATGQLDSTLAIQKAIDAASAASGGIVFFPTGDYRVAGVLTVSASGVVLRGTGTGSVLRFTKTSGMAYSASLTFAGTLTRDVPRRLAADAETRATELLLDDASDLAPGDDVSVGWTISDAFVAEHGMTGVWTAFSGQYKPIFHRKVVSVDTSVTPHRVVLDVPIRYAAKVRDRAGVQKEIGFLREVGVEHLGLTNAVTWQAAWAEHQSTLIAMSNVTDAWIRDVHSVANAAATGRTASDTRAYHLRSGGIVIADSKRVSVLATSMENPQNRGSGGNGYLFEVSRTSEVLIADSVGRNGRHNFIQNWGFGNSGTVFLRCVSSGSEMLSNIGGVLTPEVAYSEHHHSLGMATLVDDCRIDDGFNFENRGAYSTGAGHTATESVVWRPAGSGTIISKQYGWGYVVGTRAGMTVDTNVESEGGQGTGPADFVEGRDQGETLFPASLYEDQRARRLAAR